jgi:hypothetical protein
MYGFTGKYLNIKFKYAIIDKKGLNFMKYTKDYLMYSFEDAPVTTLVERIQRLEDIFKIRECLYHYVKYCDQLDPIGMGSCFTQTARLSWGPAFPGVFEGKEAINKHLHEIIASFTTKSQSHLTFNQQVLFETNDSAIVHSYMHAWKTYSDDTKDYYCFGRYELAVIRDTDGEWRIDSMMFLQAGEIEGDRLGEYFERPWPPVPIAKKTDDTPS